MQTIEKSTIICNACAEVDRAMELYFERFDNPAQPSRSSSLHELNGEAYAVLENIRGPLAVYRSLGDNDDGPILEFVPEAEWPDGFTLMAEGLPPMAEDE